MMAQDDTEPATGDFVAPKVTPKCSAQNPAMPKHCGDRRRFVIEPGIYPQVSGLRQPPANQFSAAAFRRGIPDSLTHVAHPHCEATTRRQREQASVS